MGVKGGAMASAPVRVYCCLALLCVAAATVPTDIQDDGVLDDLDVSQLQDQDISGELFHEDSAHMSDADVSKASKVFDVLYPSDDDDEDDLGESEEVQEAKESVDAARAARKEATKELLSAKGEAAKQKAKKMERKIEKAKEEERDARKKILNAKGLEQTEKATRDMEKAKRKVKKDEKKAAAMGVVKGEDNKGKARSKEMKKEIF